MDIPSGIGKNDRIRITALLRATQGTISVGEAAKILQMSRKDAAKYLSRWTAKGWFSRVKRGVYIAVPLESATANIALEDPWIIAEKLYHPCYIAGWSAAEHWGLTEQIFRTIVVKTTQTPKNYSPVIKGTRFLLSKTSEQKLFGLKAVWQKQTKVMVSDSSRTIVDLLAEPKLGGGIRAVSDMLKEYLSSKHCDLDGLIDYATQFNNGAVFKRLGYLLERFAPNEKAAIEACRGQLTAGKVKLDPQLEADALITRWRLWVPQSWKEEVSDDI